MNVVILEVPSDTEFKNLPQNVQDAIRSVGGDFIREIMPGTRVFGGKKAINSVVYADLDTIEAMIVGFELSWAVLAMQSALKVPQFDAEGEPIIAPEAVDVYRPVPSSFIEYCADIFDDDGNPSRPMVIPPLAKFSGHEGWILPA